MLDLPTKMFCILRPYKNKKIKIKFKKIFFFQIFQIFIFLKVNYDNNT